MKLWSTPDAVEVGAPDRGSRTRDPSDLAPIDVRAVDGNPASAGVGRVVMKSVHARAVEVGAPDRAAAHQ